MATITESNGESPFSKNKEDLSSEVVIKNDVKVFKFKDEPPQEYIDMINDPNIELGPMTNKILDDGTFMSVIYVRVKEEA